MAAEQAPQAQARAELLRAKKIFVAKGGILSYSHTICTQLRAGQNARVKALYFDLSSESSFQLGDEISMNPVGASKNRHTNLQSDYKGNDRHCRLPPLLQLVHLARKSRRVRWKRVGAKAAPQAARRFRLR